MDTQTSPDPVARARELGAEIAAAADEIERTRRIPEALLARLHDSRLFRMLLPRSAGGDETEPAVYVAAVEELARLASTKGVAVTQLALAWLLAQGDDIVPIPGTRSEKRLAENVGAVDVELTEGDLARVNEILPEGSYGSRYPAEMMPDA